MKPELENVLRQARDVLKSIGQTDIIILCLDRDNKDDDPNILVSGETIALTALILEGAREVIASLQNNDPDGVDTVLTEALKFMYADMKLAEDGTGPAGRA